MTLTDERSLSSILICRFHLMLQKRNAHPNINTTGSLPLSSIGGFHTAAQKMHDAVVDEFGDSNTLECFETETPEEGIMFRDDSTTGDGVRLMELQTQPQGCEIAVEA